MFTYGVQQNKISLNRFVQIMSANPAKIFGMYPKKGTISPGSDADIILFDPTREGSITAKTSLHRCDYSAFEGFKTKGETVGVMVRGEWAFHQGQITVQKGRGQFVPRKKFHVESARVL
jgi:dihydropyrimidinase